MSAIAGSVPPRQSRAGFAIGVTDEWIAGPIGGRAEPVGAGLAICVTDEWTPDASPLVGAPVARSIGRLISRLPAPSPRVAPGAGRPAGSRTPSRSVLAGRLSDVTDRPRGRDDRAAQRRTRPRRPVVGEV